MEYLMTYGWAILIIAVVLAALFYLGLFNSSAFSSTVCLASAGFECSSTTLSHTTGIFSAAFGQNTGNDWTSGNVFLVGTGAPSISAVPTDPSCSTSVQQITGGFASGQITTLSISGYVSGGNTIDPTCTTFSSAGYTIVGAQWTGTMWVEFLQVGQTSPQYEQVGTVTVKSS